MTKSNRKNINTAGKKGRTAKIYTMNIERKRLLKQRRVNTLQNTKGKRLAEEYFLTALKASCKTYKALKNEQKKKKNDNGSINDENMNITMIANNINNLEIVTNNDATAIMNAKNVDIEPTDTDNINTADTEKDNADLDNDKSNDIIMSDHNDDNSAMSDNRSPQTIPDNDNAEDTDLGENSTEDAPSPYSMAEKQMTQIRSKPQRGADLLRAHPWNLQWVIHTWIKMPQANQMFMYLILLMCEYMNSFLKGNQTPKT